MSDKARGQSGILTASPVVYRQIVEDLLIAWEEHKERTTVEEFLKADAIQRSAGELDPNTVAEICETIEQVEEKHRDVRECLLKGGSREKWLEGQLHLALTAQDAAEQDAVLGAVRRQLTTANKTLGELLQVGTGSTTTTVKVLEDVRSAALAWVPLVKENTHLAAVATGLPDQGLLSLATDLKSVHASFASELGSLEERGVKKVVSYATTIAAKKGLIPSLQHATPTTISLIVDRGITAAKVGAKVGSGQITAADAAEYLIDRASAAVSVAVTRTCARVGGQVGAAVGAGVGSLFGPVGTFIGREAGRMLGAYAGEKVGESISRGVEKVATKAKEYVRAGYDTVKSTVATVTRSVASFCRSLFS